jgi:hypothetical protein
MLGVEEAAAVKHMEALGVEEAAAVLVEEQEGTGELLEDWL